jgi:hypothetical protein
MANEKTEKGPGLPAAAEKDALGPRIPAKHLFLDKERDLPGHFGSSLNGGGGARNQKRWWVDFLPRVSLYEIRFSEASSDAVVLRYIPREWGSFQPL